LGLGLHKERLRERSDEELMALWVESRARGLGETAAFELLWERYVRETHQLVRRILGTQRSLAEEVVQDAWLEVTRAESYRPGSFRAWIRTVATRKALDRLSSVAIRMAAAARSGGEEEDHMATLVGDGPDPARGARAREAAATVLEIARDMPHVQRAAWVLKYVEGLTFEELADAMGTPLGTAKTRVRLANAFLAEALEARGISPADLEEEP
jgi:RNA polymerase sigma-70 factor (ECF subfamily)